MKNLQLLLILLLLVPAVHAAGLEIKEEKHKEAALTEEQIKANAALVTAVHQLIDAPCHDEL